MKLTFAHAYWKMLLVLALSACSLSAATPLYQISFKDEQNLPVPKNWQKAGPKADADAFTLTKDVFRTDQGQDFVVAWFTGKDAKGDPAESWTDYTVKGVVRQSGEAMTGIVARFKNPTSFYHARINSTGPKAKFELYRIGGPGGSKALAEAALVNYPAGASWRIELTVSGTAISARLIDDTGTEMASLSGDDNEYHNGSAGVRVNSRGYAAVAESLSVTAP